MALLANSPCLSKDKLNKHSEQWTAIYLQGTYVQLSQNINWFVVNCDPEKTINCFKMDDPELDQIRQQRLAQLQAQQGVSMNHGKWG